MSDTAEVKEDCLRTLVNQNNELAAMIVDSLQDLTGQLSESGTKASETPPSISVIDDIIDDLKVLRRRLRVASELLSTSLIPKVGK